MDRTGFCLWFTGLSGPGKSTIANIVVDELRARGHRVELLDGDEVREHLSKGLTFSKEDRDTNIRRIGFVASLLARNGVVAVTAAISPYRAVRDEVRGWIDNFVEIHVATSLEDCEARDVKGLYAKARAGEIPEFTGVSDPYEPPLAPRDPHRDRGQDARGVRGRGRRLARAAAGLSPPASSSGRQRGRRSSRAVGRGASRHGAVGVGERDVERAVGDAAGRRRPRPTTCGGHAGRDRAAEHRGDPVAATTDTHDARRRLAEARLGRGAARRRA